MDKTAEELLEILYTIEGNGSFVTSGTKNSIIPGLHIANLGDISLPISVDLAKKIIQKAHKAPFGKGSETVLDTNVRSAWEIDANQLSFRNAAWEPFLKKIVKQAQKALGLEKQAVTSSLYKLLIYEEGDFFLPHKDSEKEPGMFGTLILSLPSEHKGGELFVRFDGEEEVVDFSTLNDGFQIPYVAFYADCEHEIKPVTSGYRVCLVYNLLLEKAKNVALQQHSKQMNQLAHTLGDFKADEVFPKAVLLEHEYTPTNFSLGGLKGQDIPRANTLIAAAEKAGYFAALGLVTYYQQGEWEEDYDSYSRKRGRYYDYDDDEPGEGSMGEIYEEYTKVEAWAKDGTPGLGELLVTEENLIAEIELGQGDPSNEAFEGYTGNAGMTMEYWYHYGAVMLWPKNQHFEILQSSSAEVQVEWLSYYLHNWESTEIDAPEYIRQIIRGLDFNEVDFDLSVLVAALIKLNDLAFVKEHGLPILQKGFTKINNITWLQLLNAYEPAVFSTVFLHLGTSNNAEKLYYLFQILRVLIGQGITSFVESELDRIPKYLMGIQFHDFEDADRTDWRYYRDGTQFKSTLIAMW